MAKIHLLDSLLVNQIAAGEVVARPASVVKELLENSIDAGATQIDIEIKQGGVHTISITDNGYGIDKDDLSLALLQHATSKISQSADLHNINSLGFRGEALASTAAVSRLQISALAQNADQAWQIAADNGKISLPVPIAHNDGTSVVVRDLFFNVPARRKFLRAEKTEFSYCEQVVKQLALNYFGIGFNLTHNQRLVYQLPIAISDEQKQQRIAKLCHADFIDNTIQVDASHDTYSLQGWVCLPTFSRSKADLQFMFVNGRMVKDKLLVHAIRQAYQDVLYRERYPAFILYLTMPPHEVDVNVHPTKAEVRFRNGNFIYTFISNALRQILQDIRPHNQLAGQAVESTVAKFLPAQPKAASYNISGKANANQAYAVSEQLPAMQAFFKLPEQKPIKPLLESIDTKQRTEQPVKSIQVQSQPSLVAEKTVEENDIPPLGYAIAQLNQTYILAENKQGLVMVEVHAAHERIVYERMKTDYHAAAVPSQKLLMPIQVTITEDEREFVSHNQLLLERMGFALVTGRNGISITAIPITLKDCDIKQLIEGIIADCMAYGHSDKVEQDINTILGNMACKQALKSNCELSIEQMNALLRQVETTQYSSQCNHGRPTWVVQTAADIDKLFLHGR